MRISHDKVSGALYVKLREGKYDHTEDFSEGADVYLDVDAEGRVLGLEALSFEDLAQAIDERGGKLEVPKRFRATDLSDSGPDDETLRDAIDSLDMLEREITILLIYDGLTLSEAAEYLGVSFSVAARWRSSAFRSLSAKLYDSTATPGTDQSIDDALSKLHG